MRSYDTVEFKQKCGCGNIHISILYDKDRIKQLHATLGKTGTCAYAKMKFFNNVSEVWFNMGASIDTMINCCNNIHCIYQTKHKKGGTTYSCFDAIAQALKEFKEERYPKKIKKK